MSAQEDAVIEAVARAICRANCGPVMHAKEPERVECQVENGWDMWTDEARAAISIVIEECAKIADAEGLSPNASASYCAAAFHIGMCIRALKSVPPGEK